MNVARQGIRTFDDFGFMHQGPRPTPERAGVHLDSQVGGRVARMVVMIAANEVHLQGGMPGPPVGQASEGLGLLGPGAMQQVTEEDEFSRSGGVKQVVQALDHRGFRGGRHGQAMTPEGVALAEMRVGHQQQPQLWVEGGTLRPQFEGPPIRAAMNRRTAQGQRGTAHRRRLH
jgi:hypothetical protein